MRRHRWAVEHRADEAGASAVEYAILVALIAIVILGAVTLLGTRTQGLFQRSCDAIPHSARPARPEDRRTDRRSGPRSTAAPS